MPQAGEFLERAMARYLAIRTTAFLVLTSASTAVLALPYMLS